MERDALIGVSLTGIASCPVLEELDFEEAAKVVIEENKRVSQIIGINEAKRTTVTKPSGTTSLALETSSGIHAWHARLYIRRQKFNKTEPIYKYLTRVLPDLLVDDLGSPETTAILELPVSAPLKGIVNEEEGAIELLRRIGRFNREWINSGHRDGANKHNVSCTVNYETEELPEIREWMWYHRNDYSGIALFPNFTSTYSQLPFEEISQERFDEMSKYLKEIDLSSIIEEHDETDLQGELACSGGACENEF